MRIFLCEIFFSTGKLFSPEFFSMKVFMYDALMQGRMHQRDIIHSLAFVLIII